MGTRRVYGSYFKGVVLFGIGTGAINSSVVVGYAKNLEKGIQNFDDVMSNPP